MVIRVFAMQHIKEENKQEKGNCRADGEAGAGKEQTKLIYHELSLKHITEPTRPY